MPYLMQARSSATMSMKTWKTDNPDYAGTFFPGPGFAQEIAATKLVGSTSRGFAIEGEDGDPILTEAGDRIYTEF